MQDELSPGALRIAFDVTAAAFEEAMREHGIMPDTIKVVTARARANLVQLDEDDA